MSQLNFSTKTYPFSTLFWLKVCKQVVAVPYLKVVDLVDFDSILEEHSVQ